jgi:hypothetical protein
VFFYFMKSLKSYLMLYAGFAVLAIGLVNYHMDKISARKNSIQVSDDNINPPVGPNNVVNNTDIASASAQNQIQTTPHAGTKVTTKSTPKATQSTISKPVLTPTPAQTQSPPSQPKVTPPQTPVEAPPVQEVTPPIETTPIQKPIPAPSQTPVQTPIAPTEPLDNPLPVGVPPNLDTGNLDQILVPQIPSKPSTNDGPKDEKDSTKSGNKLLFNSIY